MNTLDQLDTAISDLRTAVATCVDSPKQEYLQSLIERLIGPAAELREQCSQVWISEKATSLLRLALGLPEAGRVRLIDEQATHPAPETQDMVSIPRSVVLEFKALAESSHRISALVAVLEAWPVEEQKDDARVGGFPDGEHGDLPQSGNRETGTNSC